MKVSVQKDALFGERRVERAEFITEEKESKGFAIYCRCVFPAVSWADIYGESMTGDLSFWIIGRTVVDRRIRCHQVFKGVQTNRPGANYTRIGSAEFAAGIFALVNIELT